MKKNLLLKIGLTVFSLGLFYPLFTSAAIKFNLTGLQQIYALSKDKMADNMMYVHFADNGNDFGGFLYFSNGIGGDLSEDNTELYTVTTDSSNTQDYECRSKVRGFYYNAERGERLWPLDNETWKGLTGLEGLEVIGGIYTVCAYSGYQAALAECEAETYSGCTNCDYKVCAAMVRNEFEADGYGYYGSLQHVYSGQTGILVMGVEYDANDNNKFISIESGSKLMGTFVRLNNKYPVGFVYDTNGGIGLAGCRSEHPTLTGMKELVKAVQSGGLANVFSVVGTGVVYKNNVSGVELSCNNISFEDMLLKIVIEGIMGISDLGIGGDTKFGGLGNQSSTKMQYFGTKSVSNITMMNYARRRSELLCRGKWLDNIPDNLGSVGDILCLKDGEVDAYQAKNIKDEGKTLIVKNGSVTILPMSGADNSDKYYDIFILSGDLLIDETDAKKFVIDDKGFIDTTKNVNDFNINAIALSNGITDSTEFSGKVAGCISQIEECENNGGENCTRINFDKCNYWMDLNKDGSIDSEDVDILNDYNGDFSDVLAVASAIQGNFIVNGNVKSANEGALRNKYFIYGKITTKDTFNSLENVFSWRCNSQMGSDGYPCPRFGPYRNAALVVIDQNYSSPLLQS